MNYEELTKVLDEFNQAIYSLEEMYAESEGEVTDATEKAEAQIANLKILLSGEGVDFLGRWLKAKEDRKKALKAERDYLTRQMSAIDQTIDFIKCKVNQVLTSIGQEKVKGANGYAFKATESVTTSVDKDVLKALYEDRVKGALVAAHIPAYIGFTLTASSTKAEEFGLQEGDEELFHTTSKPTCTFTKPRANKEG